MVHYLMCGIWRLGVEVRKYELNELAGMVNDLDALQSLFAGQIHTKVSFFSWSLFQTTDSEGRFPCEKSLPQQVFSGAKITFDSEQIVLSGSCLMRG